MKIPFEELAAKVQGWYRDQRLSHAEIAAKLIAEDIQPALGHSAWTWRSVDAVLVLAASQRRALGQDATP